ncbi:DUF2585 domain-containing protein [soil metagenome]
MLPETNNFAPRRLPAIVLLAMLAVAIVYLRWQGRVWWCQQGDWFPISFVVNSPHNSQHVFDAYSLSHMLHGLLFYGFFWLFRKRMSFRWRLVAATAVEIGWEMLENSPIIINRYRTATMSLRYEGDSIINSIGDIVSYLIGFYIAAKVGLKWSIAIFLAIDLAMLWWIRDNLALNVLMLLWPIDAIRKWQAGG